MLDEGRILFLSPAFFGYEKVITAALKKKFKQVDYIDLRGTTSYLTRKLGFSNKAISYSILEKLSKYSYDIIFIIKGENISEHLIKKISSIHKGDIRLYNWDSVKSFNNTHLFGYCSKVFSFDPLDCKSFCMVYKELFATELLNLEQLHFKNKLMFIGTARNDRIKILYKIFNRYGFNLDYVVNLYFQSIFVYLIRILLNPYLIKMPWDFIYFKKIPYDKYLRKLEQVSYVLDIESETQSGLTVRSIEALCNGKILLTTNTFALHTPLYTGENVLLINRTDKDPLSAIRLDKEIKAKVSPDLVQNYHVDIWLEDFFD